jgi:hypothetical protein
MALKSIFNVLVIEVMLVSLGLGSCKSRPTSGGTVLDGIQYQVVNHKSINKYHPEEYGRYIYSITSTFKEHPEKSERRYGKYLYYTTYPCGYWTLFSNSDFNVGDTLSIVKEKRY